MTRYLGYKFVEANLTRRGVQYRVGEWTDPIPDPIPCERGYHYCPDPLDLVVNYPDYGPTMLLVESDGPGAVQGDKVAASRLYVHQVLPWNDRVAEGWTLP